MILEPHGDLVDGLSQCMHADELRSFFIDGRMSVGDLKDILAKQCHWATEIDYSDKSNSARFWYTSAEKLEPRLGDRFEEAGASNELPLSIGRYIKSLNGDLEKWQDDALIADFLIAHPEHRHTVRRVQNLARHPYSEIQDNLISSDLLPIDLLRCKLSFFGATKFDPRSDRWVRICMYQDAPYPHEILESVR
jgi:hypothetical protein